MTENSSSENVNQVKKACSQCLSQIDPLSILNRVKGLVLNPRATWDEIKSEQLSVQDIYFKYLIPLMFVSTLASFLGMQIFGMKIPFVGTFRPPFFSALVGTIFQFAFGLVAIYIGSFVISKVSEKFGGSTKLDDSFRLFAFAYVPVLFVGILGIIPFLGLLSILVALYAIYLYYLGSAPMLSVPDDKKLIFSVVSIVATFIVMVIIGLLVSLVSPEMNIPELSPNAQQSLESLENLSPALEKYMDNIKQGS